MSQAKQIFRPAFTGQEVADLYKLCATHIPGTVLCKKLSTFNHKVINKILEPAYTLVPPVEEKLGIVSIEKKDWKLIRALAYDKWCTDPASCTLPELEYAMTYRFENGLMSPVEEQEYLVNQIKG